jgi:hypothetical protein
VLQVGSGGRVHGGYRRVVLSYQGGVGVGLRATYRGGAGEAKDDTVESLCPKHPKTRLVETQPEITTRAVHTARALGMETGPSPGAIYRPSTRSKLQGIL